MSNPTVADIKIHANLIEHYLYTQDAPIAPGPLNRFVSVFDGSASHLLTVDSSGQMLHCKPDTSSQSGWRTTTVPVPAPSGAGEMFSITAFFASSILHAIVLFEAPGGYATTWLTRTAPGQWSQANVTFEASSLLSLVSQAGSYIDASGNAYVYGFVPPCLGDLQAQEGSAYQNSAQFYILFFDPTKNAWDVLYQSSLGNMNAPTAMKFHVIPSDKYPDYPIQVIWATPSEAVFANAVISPAQGGFTWAPNSDWLSVPTTGMQLGGVNRILPFPSSSFPGCVLVLGNDGVVLVLHPDPGQEWQVWSVNVGRGPSNVAALSVSQINGSSGQIALFALEGGTNSLWIIRQDVEPGVPPFSSGNWVNLGNHAEAIATPEVVQGGAEVYFADPELNVYHLAQNPTDGIWATQKIAAPVASSSAPQKISATMMQVMVVDTNGNPVPDAPIAVTSDQWANIVVDDLCYLPGPGTPVSIQADATGNASVFYHATSLAMPIFTLSSGSAQNSCQGDVVGHTTTPVSPSSVANRLAGNDPNHPINQTTLQNANLLAPNSDPTDSIQAINQLGQAMLKQSASAAANLDLSSITVRHWRLDFKDGGAKFRVLTEEEAAVLRNAPAAGRAGMPGSPGNIFSDIFGDIVNFFEHALHELESITVSIAGDVINFAINGVKYIVTTARQIGAAIQMVFAKIAEGLADIYTIIKEVIEFLEMLFHWADILATHRVLKACANSFFNVAESSVGDIQTLVQAKISDLQQNLAEAITKLQQQFGSQTFNGYANTLPPPSNSRASSSSNTLAAQSTRDGYNQHLSRCQYVYSKSKKHFSVPSSPGAASSIDLSNLQTQFTKFWSDSIINFIDSITSKISSFSDLFDLAIVDLLQLAEDFIDDLLKGAEAIVTAILDLVGELISGLQGVINATLDIPVISWLYKYVITGTIVDPGDDLTILDVLCLIFAVPVTILYKLLYNDSAPFTSDDAAYFEQNGLAWPIAKLPGSAASSASAGPKSLTAAPASAYMALGICGGFCNLLNGAIASVADALAFALVPPPGLVTAVSYISIVGGTIGQVLQAPWSLWTGDSSWTAADGWTTALWCASCVPAIYDSLFTFVTGDLARNTNELGPLLDTGAGFALIGLSAATMVAQMQEPSEYSGWDYVNAVVPQFQRLPRFLITQKEDEELAPVYMAILTIADVVVGAASCATQIGASAWDWEKDALGKRLAWGKNA